MILLICIVLPLSGVPEQGIASWYDSDPDANLTANGERFDPQALTAAHKSLTFGTIVRVHDLSNGKSVDVRINDRGPFVEGRIIDLTPAAARVLDMYERGISPVELEILYTPRIPDSQYNRPGDTGWYLLQLGSFANTESVYPLYMKLYDLGFSPQIEIVQNHLLRLSVRWIPEHQKEQSLMILKELGFESPLIRGDILPQ
jgi:rare lipoprotein A